MKKFLLSLSLLFVCYFGCAQCPPTGNITLRSQADIDNFKTDYPNCTEIGLDIIIQGSSINNLDGLDEIVKITRHLKILDTTLSNFSGLNTLTNVGGAITVSRNNSLTSLTGLEQLLFIGEKIDLSRNPALSSLQGLENVTSIGSLSFTHNAFSGLSLSDSQVSSLLELSSLVYISGLNLSGNQITSLAGLENLSTVEGGITIGGELISDLTGLENITSLSTGLSIFSNNNLVSLHGLDNLVSVGGNMKIWGNALLTDLRGLEALTDIISDPRGFDGNLEISQSNITSLTGLSSLSSVYKLDISGNPLLQNLEGLTSLRLIKEDFQIRQNENLDNLQGLETLQTIEGNFSIRDNYKLTSLSGLSGLLTIGNILDLVQNNLLTNLNGLSQIQSIGGLTLHYNNEMVSLEGIETLQEFSKSNLNITSNEKLSDLSALINASTTGESISVLGNSAIIQNNPALESLNGLENLGYNERQYSISLTNNATLNDISALEGWDAEGIYNIKIQNNPSLAMCQVTPVCSFMLTANPWATISGNLGICENAQDLTIACSPDPACPTTAITLSSQEEIDNFASNYAYCTKPQVSITIEGSDIVNLNGLAVITDIEGSLIIKNNPLLQYFNGLSNLVHVSGDLVVENNPKITSLYGLGNIDGLSLTNLTIKDNATLSNCSLASVCNFMAKNIDTVIIENNTGDCISAFDVMMRCNDLCPSQIILLRTQAEVDNFKLNYPNCTVPTELQIQAPDPDVQNLDGLDLIMAVKGDLIIGRDRMENTLTDISGLNKLRYLGGGISINNHQNLTNLNGLESLKHAQRGVVISNNPALENLNGLRNIEYSGALTISNNDLLTNLNGLETLSSLNGSIIIKHNTNLISLEGLNNIETSIISGEIVIDDNENLERLVDLSSITTLNQITGGYLGNLQISRNDKLVDISGLSSMETIQGFASINDNAAIKNLTGLNNIKSVGESLSIKVNNNLTSIEGLGNLTSVKWALIQDNEALTNLNGLENLKTITNSLQIIGNDELSDINGISNLDLSTATSVGISFNPKLSLCNQPNICEYVYYSDNYFFGNNAIGCSTAEEIIASCNASTNSINGTVRFDDNGDGCDLNETPVPNLTVETTDGTKTLKTFTDSNGAYNLLVREGTFTTSGRTNASSFGINPNNQESIFTDSGNSETVDFCVTATTNEDNLSIILLPMSESRPGFDSEYSLVYQNSGSTTQSGTVSFEFESDKLTFLESTPLQSSITGNIVTWNYLDLKPFETRTINLAFNITAPPTNNITEEINFATSITPLSNDVTTEDNIFSLKQTLIGSYDPNDKTVLEGESIFIEDVGNFLNYVIRFQNTGTASAINVKIKDILSENLDWDTFTPISSSHENTILITDGNKVEFIFEGINLPDSTSDEPGSNGYVSFKIKPKSGIAIGDIINGTASIYFDFNPPIITNTVSTEVVLPDIDGDGIENDQDNCPEVANPGQEDTNDNGIGDVCEVPPLVVQLFQTIAISCNGSTDAALETSTTGGVTPYNFELYDASTSVLLRSQQSQSVFENLPSGSYYVSVSDGNSNQSQSNIIEILEPLPLIATITIDNVTCFENNDARAAIEVSGGSGDYEFSIDGGASFQSTNIYENLAAGVYIAVIQDANGCTYNQIFEIAQGHRIIPNIVSTNATCEIADGSITINIADNPDEYMFSISDNPDLSNLSLSNRFTDLEQGTYNVWVAHNSGCIVQSSVTIESENCSNFTLPTNNFIIETTSESCASSNNGSILLRAEENLEYTATLTGTALNESQSFRTFTNFVDLQAGSYELCITVAGETEYKKCFTLQITEPEDLSVTSKINPTNKTVSLSLKGSKKYIINVNGTEYSTSENEITIPLSKVENSISVKTDKECQGVYEEMLLATYDSISIFPNPVEEGDVTILLPSNTLDKEVLITLFSQNGVRVLEKMEEFEGRIAKVNMDALPPGVYTIIITTESQNSMRKIIKK